MLKNFRLMAIGVLVIAHSISAIAQTETYKDVVLDGKPAKLNVKTGEVKLVKLKTINGKTVVDTTSEKTVIQSNLITNTTTVSKTSVKDVTKVKDTMQSKVSHVDTMEKPKEDSQTKISSTDDTTVSQAASSKVDKVTSLVYEVPATSESKVENFDSDFHLVKKNETLYSLSKRYNTTLGELMRANNLETTLIKTGQTLRVRNFDAEYDTNIWTVTKGDTLYSIAKKTNTTVESIKTLNGLSSNLIKIGQVLRLK